VEQPPDVTSIEAESAAFGAWKPRAGDKIDVALRFSQGAAAYAKLVVTYSDDAGMELKTNGSRRVIEQEFTAVAEYWTCSDARQLVVVACVPPAAAQANYVPGSTKAGRLDPRKVPKATQASAGVLGDGALLTITFTERGYDKFTRAFLQAEKYMGTQFSSRRVVGDTAPVAALVWDSGKVIKAAGGKPWKPVAARGANPAEAAQSVDMVLKGCRTVRGQLEEVERQVEGWGGQAGKKGVHIVPRFLQTRYPVTGAQCKVRNFGVFPRMREGDGYGAIRDHGELDRDEGGSGAPLYYCQTVRDFTITPPRSTSKKSAQQGGGVGKSGGAGGADLPAPGAGAGARGGGRKAGPGPTDAQAQAQAQVQRRRGRAKQRWGAGAAAGGQQVSREEAQGRGPER
jgi:hypothetical protein